MAASGTVDSMSKEDFAGVCADLATIYSALAKLTAGRYDESFHEYLERASDPKSFECDLLFGACALLKAEPAVSAPKRL